MAKVTDIQDKNGVSKEIQDKDLAQQTAATAIASTDYVMLQDTSGGYHKIAKASFTEAVRSALGSVINSTAKGTDISKMPVLDSNNDLGMGTLANIASVLGATLFDSTGKNNLDTIDRSHANFGLIAPTCPEPFPGHCGSWYYIPSGANVGLMIAIDSSNKRTFYRLYDSEWKEWNEYSTNIPSFYKNYAELSSLATGLGVSGMTCVRFGSTRESFQAAFASANPGVVIGIYSPDSDYCIVGEKASDNYGSFIKISYGLNSIFDKCCLIHAGAWTWY